MKNSERPNILYGEADPQVLSTQIVWFERTGASVVKAIGRAAVEETIKRGGFDLVILGHSLSKDDRHHLAYAAKKANPNGRLLVLHASGHHPKVDANIDSRQGEKAVVEIVNGLLSPALVS